MKTLETVPGISRGYGVGKSGVENGNFDSHSAPVHSRPHPLARRSKFPPRLKLYLHEGGRGRGKRRSIPATFPLCTHDARDESWTLSRDGIRWVRKPFEKESSGCGGGEGRARRKCFLSFPLLRGNLRFESPPGVHKSCVLGFRGSGN